MTTWLMQYNDGTEDRALIISDPNNTLAEVDDIAGSYPELFDTNEFTVIAIISIPDDWEPKIFIEGDELPGPLLRKDLPL